MLKTNLGYLSGRIINIKKIPYLDDVLLGNFFIGIMEIVRKSGKTDFVNVLLTFSDIKEHPMLINNGKFIISGSFRTHNIYKGNRRESFQAFYPNEIIEHSNKNYESTLINKMINKNNVINLQGKIFKIGKQRSIKSRKEKTNFLLKVQENSPNFSSIIPCVAWEANSEFVSMLDEGESINIQGSIQSRLIKKFIRSRKNKKKSIVKTNTINEIIAYRISSTFDFDENNGVMI